MAVIHIAKQGDSLTSIAEKNGISVKNIYADPNNNKKIKLQDKRPNPDILNPGDEVYIPEKKLKYENCETGKKHKIQILTIQDKLMLQMTKNGKPRANEKYTLTLDDNKDKKKGTTGADGKIEHTVSRKTKKAVLIFGNNDESYTFQLRYLNNVDDTRGIKARLLNLGYNCKSVDDKMTQETIEQIKIFQNDHKLDLTGKADDPTQKKMQKVHGA